ncbi:MAG: hypothetical protein ACOH2H_17165 [Cypionkella sp.]
MTDFVNAVSKELVVNPAYEEGWMGDLQGGAGKQQGLVVSNVPNDGVETSAHLGIWLTSPDGKVVKALTKHHVAIQEVLSDQRLPEDPNAVYQLDDNLDRVGGNYGGMDVVCILPLFDAMNASGAVDIMDVLRPNETTIGSNVAVGTDYFVTMKDDCKQLMLGQQDPAAERYPDRGKRDLVERLDQTERYP